MSRSPQLRTLAALGLLTACTLALQVVLTRLFSAVLAYHFSFLAISLSLLGTGAGALVVYVRSKSFDGRSTDELLARWAGWLALSLILIPFLLVRLDFTFLEVITPGFALNLAAACALATVPSYAGGVVVALAISRFTPWIARVYAYDLVGAGLGALAVVPVLWLADAPTLVVCLGIVAAVAAILFAPPTFSARAPGFGFLLLGGLAVLLSLTTRALYLEPRYGLSEDAYVVAERWTPLTRAFGYEMRGNDNLALLLYDRAYAPVPIVRDDQIPDWKTLGTGPQSIGYEINGPGRTLIIGGGGGRDIYTALSMDQESVDVIELNEGVRGIVDEDLAHLSGSPYSRERVSTTIGDGRSILAARDDLYDQIHIGFTDTLSSSAAQGFALSENNLYTLEAFREYFDHLAPGGVLNVSRLLKLVGDEALRVTVLTLAALEQRGIADPNQHVVVILGTDVLGPPTGTVLARLTPWTEAEVMRIQELAEERGQGLLFAPSGPYEDEWRELAEAESLESFCNGYLLDVCPPTDDKPFFFRMLRLGQIGERVEGYMYATTPFSILIVTLVILAVLSVVAFVLPLGLARDTEPPSVGSLSFFLAIGLGFLLVEITLIQRFVLFLGFPTYALSVVLFALLVFSGIGSLLTSSIRDPRRGLVAVLVAASLLIAVSAFGLQPLLRSLIDLPFAARVLVAVVLLAPFGLLLGAPMPIGLRRFEALHPRSVPYAWGVNGVASVFASVLGVVVAINFGFMVAGLLGAACYAFALLHAATGRWPSS